MYYTAMCLFMSILFLGLSVLTCTCKICHWWLFHDFSILLLMESCCGLQQPCCEQYFVPLLHMCKSFSRIFTKNGISELLRVWAFSALLDFAKLLASKMISTIYIPTSGIILASLMYVNGILSSKFAFLWLLSILFHEFIVLVI